MTEKSPQSPVKCSGAGGGDTDAAGRLKQRAARPAHADANGEQRRVRPANNFWQLYACEEISRAR